MAPTPLSARLRELRMRGSANGFLKQSRLAEAIGVTAASISAYETGAAVPPPDRLRRYALFFASGRWMDRSAPRQVVDGYLTDAENEAFAELHDELRSLADDSARHAMSTNGTAAFWRFPNDEPVRILCGRLDDEGAGRYAKVTDPNFMALRNAADLDSLVELWGHIRRLNPESDVRYVFGDDFTSGDLQGHVVVLGNIARMQGGGRLLPDDTLPVRQVTVSDLDGEVFEIGPPVNPTRFEPVIVGGRVVEDVGLIARVPNPNHMRRTFTICSGVFTRGVYGAVRCLTDRGLRDSNTEYLADTFPDLTCFGLLMRVRVTGHAVPTPDLHNPHTRLLEIRTVR